LKRTENEESSRKAFLHSAWAICDESRSVLLLSRNDLSWKREFELRVQKLGDEWTSCALLLARGVGDGESFDLKIWGLGKVVSDWLKLINVISTRLKQKSKL
jgi:hypothetical protein